MAKGTLGEGKYSWKSNGRETIMPRTGHGDLSVIQVSDGKRNGIGYYDSSWTQFPKVVAKYASEIDSELCMANWKECMSGCGWDGVYIEPPRGDCISDFMDYDIMRISVKSKKESLSQNPHFISYNGLRGLSVIPAISGDDLVFLREIRSNDAPGAISIEFHETSKPYEEALRFSPDDLPELLMGTVYFSTGFSDWHCCDRMCNLASILRDWDIWRGVAQ